MPTNKINKTRYAEYEDTKHSFFIVVIICFVAFAFLAFRIDWIDREVIHNGNYALLENTVNNHNFSKVMPNIPNNELVISFCKERGYDDGWISSLACDRGITCYKYNKDGSKRFDCITR